MQRTLAFNLGGGGGGDESFWNICPPGELDIFQNFTRELNPRGTTTYHDFTIIIKNEER